MSVLIRSNYFECRVSKYDERGGEQNGKNGHPPMESKIVKYHRYIEFTLSRDLTNCERLRPKSVSVSIRKETQDRSTISSAKRSA